ncbi:Increased rDNA silencing protein [Saxophila tyrrhenica]|uniref:Increased rDNA silencing protein n=1 Tax=Saxophila tyrrhenica TaxID=1690608 RepID=A0AAV9P8E2_9PEZI|nr:Increased rDNA silencing protein [Saxophila tyrrhenica]
MQAPRSPSRTPSYASTAETGTSPRNAALLGAATAFGRPPTKARAQEKTPSGVNSALAAAARAGTSSPSPNARLKSPAPPLQRQTTGESVRSVKSSADRLSLGASRTARLGVPDPVKEPSKSPSRQAASFAAASTPQPSAPNVNIATSSARADEVRGPPVGSKPRSFRTQQPQNGNQDSKQTDSSPIPPTTSLVDLFERKSRTPEGKRPEPVVIKPSSQLALRSPKPTRQSGGITSLFEMELAGKGGLSKSSQHNDSASPPVLRPPESRRSSSGSYASASEDPLRETSPIRRSPSTVRGPSRNRKGTEPPMTQSRNSTVQAVRIPHAVAGNVAVRAESLAPSSASAKSIPAQYHHMYPARKMTPSMTGDQLADAMVAGSLASSRAPSPRKMDPPPPPTRRHKHIANLGFSRTPSPTKSGMRHTMRKEESESSDDSDELHPYGKHKKKRHLRKHPNKHHEGDRKRWRDAVTERERKRYEGVWAANKGLHCSFTLEEQMKFRKSPKSQQTVDVREAAADQVSNIIARDIWNRSRLPPAELETVWDLVDTGGIGRLNREEFVVGMWLIDQRLKGRKLPVKVSGTVWASVKGLQGIKIKK